MNATLNAKFVGQLLTKGYKLKDAANLVNRRNELNEQLMGKEKFVVIDESDPRQTELDEINHKIFSAIN